MITDGFWEPEFHRALLAEGKTLAFVPALRVTQRASFGIRCFCAQRLSHGRHYGEDRMQAKSWLARLARVATAPLIPVVLLLKIAQRLRDRPSYLGPFLRALPVLLLFISAWTLGETWGYLTSAPRGQRSSSARERIPA